MTMPAIDRIEPTREPRDRQVIRRPDRPPLAHFSRGVDVKVYPIRRVD